jgi:hypothetical protein
MSCVFEKKKGEELTKGGTGTRHLLPSDRTATREAGTSSSSGGTATGGACGTSSSGGTVTRGPRIAT